MSCVNCGHLVEDHTLNDGTPATACFAEHCECSEYEIAPLAPPLIDVTAAIADAVLAEREACAELVREHMKHDFDGNKISKAILARGEE